MRYVIPKLKISVFDTENIVTTSGTGIENYIPNTEAGQKSFTGTVKYSDLQDVSADSIIAFK